MIKVHKVRNAREGRGTPRKPEGIPPMWKDKVFEDVELQKGKGMSYQNHCFPPFPGLALQDGMFLFHGILRNPILYDT